MKQLSLSLLFICFLLPALFAQPKEAYPLLNAPAGQLDTIAKYAKAFPNGTQLAIALVQDDRVSYLGLIRKNDTLRNIENHQSVFEIGSITKVFTSTLLVQCAREGAVQMDAPVQDCFDFPLKAAEKDGVPLTLKTLANHSSGLPRMPPDLMRPAQSDINNPYKNYGAAELERALAETVSLNSMPGKKYHYSNLGAGLLGYILAKKMGKSYAQLLQERVFTPWQMTRSCADHRDLKYELVPGLNAAGDTVSNWDFDVLKGAGAILSTVEDLNKFMQANFGADSLLAFQREKTFTVSESMDLALGWHILYSRDGAPWHWHNGGTGGYSSQMVMDVRKKNGVIVLSNVSAFNPKAANVERICFILMKNLE